MIHSDKLFPALRRVTSLPSFVALFASATVSLLLALSAGAAERPNVLLIYTDDQGYGDLNCYGGKDLTTPHMDALAKQGVRFTQFYSAAPVCSPSRAAMLTGRCPQRAGLEANAASQPDSEGGMPAEQVTIAEMLKGAGYATGHVGKWHVGYQTELLPNGQGFDYSFGHMGGCIDNYSHFFYWVGPNRHDLWRNGKEVWADGQFFPELMVREADTFMTKHREEPWFLYWAINVPHYPLQATERWRKHYKDLPAPRRMYAAFVSTMDEMIGRVTARLEELGLAENTIVIFQSDHGYSTEQRTFGGGGSAGPYRGAKFSLFEGGIRVPAMIRWPAKLPAEQVRDQLATACDWLPTIAEYCEVKPPQRRLDGVSLAPVIRSSDATTPHPQFHWQSLRGKNGKPQWAVRDGDWKLVANPRQTSDNDPITAAEDRFLANLVKDPGERQNLAAKNPDIVKRLENLHNAWLREAFEQ